MQLLLFDTELGLQGIDLISQLPILKLPTLGFSFLREKISQLQPQILIIFPVPLLSHTQRLVVPLQLANTFVLLFEICPKPGNVCFFLGLFLNKKGQPLVLLGKQGYFFLIVAELKFKAELLGF